MTRTTAPYGSWASPFPLDLLVAGRVSLAEVRFDGPDALAWIESRPDDGGRQTLVRWTEADGARDISPAGMNVRTRVHEYGGAPSLVAGDLVVVSDFATGRLHRVERDRSSEPITPNTQWRFADLEHDRARNRLLAVREDHTGGGEAVNTIVSVPLDGSDDVRVLAAGRTFYAAPRLSPDGSQVAFLAWDHPNLPWDGTELFVARIEPDGAFSTPATRVAGSASDWIAQPAWSPDGVLHFVAEPTGWMNLHRWVDGRVEPVSDEEAEFAYPDWQFGFRNYAFAADGSIVAIGRSGGRDRLYRIPTGGSRPEEIEVPFTEMAAVDVQGERVVLEGAGPATFNSIVLVDLAGGSHRIVKASSTAAFGDDQVSTPELVEFPTTGGLSAFGLFYRPTNPAFEGPPDALPPLIVTSHGGPTAQAFGGLSVSTQLFTSRGYAVLDVDYGGSTGYGREYRKRLEGKWGIVDDCVAGARSLAERGEVDGRRLAVRGGSASGYTTLCVLAFRDEFSAGVSYFGIGDLLAFARETHKFESRYLDRLVGPLPQAEAVYRERSPNNYAGQITCPVLILQGKEDKVVPLAEAERIVDALWERRVPHAYIAFEGEDHGFRQADSIVRAFAAELSFFAQVFDFQPADDIEPLTIENLDAWRAARARGEAARPA